MRPSIETIIDVIVNALSQMPRERAIDLIWRALEKLESRMPGTLNQIHQKLEDQCQPKQS